MAKKKSRGGRPKKPPMARLSERRLIRLNTTLDAVVQVIRQQQAAQHGVPIESVSITQILRDLIRDGAKARGLINDGPGGSKSGARGD